MGVDGRGPGRKYGELRARALALFESQPELTNGQIAQRLGVSEAFVKEVLRGKRTRSRK
jgi:hypothetical protein